MIFELHKKHSKAYEPLKTGGPQGGGSFERHKQGCYQGTMRVQYSGLNDENRDFGGFRNYKIK